MGGAATLPKEKPDFGMKSGTKFVGEKLIGVYKKIIFIILNVMLAYLPLR